MKEYWEQAERLRRRINRKINEIHVLRQRAEGMNGTSSDAMPRSSSPDRSKMEVTVFKIMALEQDIKDTQREYDALIADMERRIKAVDDADDRDLLTKRYLEFKSWNTIAAEMFISKRKAYYLHNKALKSLQSDAVQFT
jgi:DNA-directed RNA polymerase specialized sigma subunit